MFQTEIRTQLSQRISEFSEHQPEIQAGHSWINRHLKEGFYESLFRAFCEAQRTANDKTDANTLRINNHFVEIIEKSLLQCVYQPIVSLQDGSISGWEAFV